MNNLPAQQGQNTQIATIEEVLIQGDLAKLTPDQRLQYVNRVCETLHLNPATRPFDYLKLNGKIVLYARKDCTDQLRKINGVSTEIIEEGKLEGGMYRVRMRASDKIGRSDEDQGVVSIVGLKGEALANAMMKATTKAKRRVTLAISGLGFMDESEAGDVTDAQPLRNPLDALEPADRAIAQLNRPLEDAPEGPEQGDTSIPATSDLAVDDPLAGPSDSKTGEILDDQGENSPEWNVLRPDGSVYRDSRQEGAFFQEYKNTLVQIRNSEALTHRERMHKMKKLYECNELGFSKVTPGWGKELEDLRLGFNKALGAEQKVTADKADDDYT